MTDSSRRSFVSPAARRLSNALERASASRRPFLTPAEAAPDNIVRQRHSPAMDLCKSVPSPGTQCGHCAHQTLSSCFAECSAACCTLLADSSRMRSSSLAAVSRCESNCCCTSCAALAADAAAARASASSPCSRAMCCPANPPKSADCGDPPAASRSSPAQLGFRMLDTYDVKFATFL